MDHPHQATSLTTTRSGDGCAVCEDLRGMLTGRRIFRRQAVGSLETCFETRCLGHGPLFKMLQAEIVWHLISGGVVAHDNDTISNVSLSSRRVTSEPFVSDSKHQADLSCVFDVSSVPVVLLVIFTLLHVPLTTFFVCYLATFVACLGCLYSVDATLRRARTVSAMMQERSEAVKGKETKVAELDWKPDLGHWNVELSFGSYQQGGSEYPLILGVLSDLPSSSDSNRLFWEPAMANSSHEPEIPGFGRVLDPEWVDLELARQWKRDCFTLHNNKCRNPFKIGAASPAWVIDTTEDCLVPGTGVEYVTLSYRWGVSAGFRTTRNLLKELQKPGALSTRSRLGKAVAPMLRNAMGLTQAIDERYLWVDAVCIVQDDESHLITQLGLMGAIYATAKLTIAACDGDAADGLLGLKGLSNPRRLHQKVTPVFISEKIIFRNRPNFKSGASPYFDRGWTFQEFYLSQRRLIFSGGQIHWHCSCANWIEELIPPDNNRTDQPLVDRHFSRLLTGVPDFQSLDVVLSQYHARYLSFPEDALPAISGLLSLLGRSFEGGFLYGLPEMVFDSALMWQGIGATRQREDSRRTNVPNQASRLPSWSWIGWQVPDLSVSDEETFTASNVSQSWRRSWTIPITQWYTHKTPEAGEKRLIRSRWFHWRDRSTFSNMFVHCKLPQGWTREKTDEALWLQGKSPGVDYRDPPKLEGVGKYIYKHDTLPGEYYWLPVPITTGSQAIDHLDLPSQTPYISCDTKRGWFTAAQFPITHFSDYDRQECVHLTTVGLLNGSGEYCGRLYLQAREDISHFPRAGSGLACEVELVAICRRRETERYENRWPLSNGKENHKWDNTSYKRVYGVLWVEWIDGVAYRRASGIVDEEEWAGHKLENVHLVMG